MNCPCTPKETYKPDLHFTLSKKIIDEIERYYNEIIDAIEVKYTEICEALSVAKPDALSELDSILKNYHEVDNNIAQKFALVDQQIKALADTPVGKLRDIIDRVNTIERLMVDSSYAFNSILTELRKKSQIKPEFVGSVQECVNPDKLYVVDGHVYAYMWAKATAPTIVIESRAGGYWWANEWIPLGDFTAVADTGAKRTNLIPVTAGDQLLYKGDSCGSPNSVVWLNANKEWLSTAQYTATSEPVLVTAPENAGYVWFNSFGYSSNLDGIILDVEWVTCQAAVDGYAWVNTGYDFIPSDCESTLVEHSERLTELESKTNRLQDSLAGKLIVYDGDSIAESRFDLNDNGGGYPKLIADATGCTYSNHAISGAWLSYRSAGHSVVGNLNNLPTGADLYCFEGGINDFWNNVPIGEVTSGYFDEVDATTICGAMETIFRFCLTNFIGAPICFIITHKVQDTAYTQNANGDTFADYHDAMVAVCNKYSIPYYDAFLNSGINVWNHNQNNAFMNANQNGTVDGCHPNEEGYKRYYVPQLINLFRSVMPME